jgi:hypothetical protein
VGRKGGFSCIFGHLLNPAKSQLIRLERDCGRPSSVRAHRVSSVRRPQAGTPLPLSYSLALPRSFSRSRLWAIQPSRARQPCSLCPTALFSILYPSSLPSIPPHVAPLPRRLLLLAAGDPSPSSSHRFRPPVPPAVVARPPRATVGQA